MRKILKAAAMLTVGGALLSTSAFAALSGTAVYNASTGKIDVNVSGLGTGESTIMVLKSATAIDAIPSTVADADIVYIDQKTATVDGTASYSIDPGTRGADVNTYYVFAGGTNESSAKFLGAATRTIAATGVVIKENGEDAATTKELTSNQTAAFTAVVSPENATETVTWTVKQGETDVTTSVLSVAADGVATFTAPVVAANTDYVVTAKAGSVSDSITITVKPAVVAVTSVTILVDGTDTAAAELAISGTAALTATVAPETATDKTVTWAAKQGETDVTDTVLSVVNGVETFTAPSVDADTVYTVTATAGGVTDTVAITVKAATTDIIYGDVDGDGNVTIDDVVVILKKLGGASIADFNETAADVDVDGSVTIDDVVRILKKLGGADVPLGPTV